MQHDPRRRPTVTGPETRDAGSAELKNDLASSSGNSHAPDPISVEDAEARDRDLRKAIDIICRKRTKAALPRLTPEQRKGLEQSIVKLAQLARESCEVRLPTVDEGRIQVQRAAQALREAQSAMKTARDKVKIAQVVLEGLGDDAFDSLFGGQLLTTPEEQHRLYGDPDAPLNVSNYDQFIKLLGAIVEQMDAAEKHARALGYYGPWRKARYHETERWKGDMVLAVALLLHEWGVAFIVKKSPGGPFHRFVNLIAGLVGLPVIAQTALYHGIADFRISTMTSNEKEAVLLARRTRVHS